MIICLYLHNVVYVQYVNILQLRVKIKATILFVNILYLEKLLKNKLIEILLT